jgi:hypothetical protein
VRETFQSHQDPTIGSSKKLEPYHLELSVFLRANNKDLWNEFEMLKARPPVASAVSREAPPVANDDEVEEEDTEL